MFNWLYTVIHALGVATAATWHWTTQPNQYWWTLGILIFISIVVIGGLWSDGIFDDDWSGARLLSVIWLGVFLWPVVAIILGYAVISTVVLVVPVWFAYSWLRLIPSREQRAEKQREKIANLRARKAEA